MFKILKATKDAYITNRIINRTRVTDANVGLAGTLDLFKLYDESILSGTDNPIEISRVLLKFDLAALRALTGSMLDYSHASFNASLKLFDVIGGQPTPSNFDLVVFPLSRSFDEGIGRDIVRFEDLDACNFITSSISNGSAITWAASGASGLGVLGASDVDVIETGDLNDDAGVVSLYVTQSFTSGDEDLSVDVTKIISGTLSGQIPDCGFLVAYSGSFETNARSLFVKRFASRHSSNTRIVPRIEVSYDDTLIDHHGNFLFDVTGSLFLSNVVRNAYSNIVSGSSLTAITGTNCLLLKLSSGSFLSTLSASQHQIGSLFVTGVYSASFVIPSNTSTLLNEIRTAGSATLTTVWSSLDNTIGYYTSSVVVRSIDRRSFDESPSEFKLNIINLKSTYKSNEVARLRVFVQDNKQQFVPKRLPFENHGTTFEKMYYRIIDYNSGDVVIGFHKNGTRMSTDVAGAYFTFYASDLDIGRSYEFEFLIEEMGIEHVIGKTGLKFRVEN